MRCPTCGFENLLGSDVCDNCGSDLAGRDVPEPATRSTAACSASTSTRWARAPPEIVDPSTDVDDAIRRMHDKGSDCVLVVEDGRLVGIFTDRDAVLKVAGTEPPDRTIAALMTPRPRRPPPRRDARGRDQQDGRRRLPPHPDRRGRPADRRRHGPRRLPASRPIAGLTAPRDQAAGRDPRPGPRLGRPPGPVDRGRRRRAGPGQDGPGARSGARLRRLRDRRPDRPGLRPDRRDRAGAVERRRGSSPSGRTTTSRSASGRSPPAPTRSSPTGSCSRTGRRRSSAGWRTPARAAIRHGARRRARRGD